MPRTRRTERQRPRERTHDPAVIPPGGDGPAVGDRESPGEDTVPATRTRKTNRATRRRLDATGTGW